MGINVIYELSWVRFHIVILSSVVFIYILVISSAVSYCKNWERFLWHSLMMCLGEVILKCCQCFQCFHHSVLLMTCSMECYCVDKDVIIHCDKCVWNKWAFSCLQNFQRGLFFNDNIDKEFKFRGYLHACHGINITVIGF